jgi:hypothetical protein
VQRVEGDRIVVGEKDLHTRHWFTR